MQLIPYKELVINFDLEKLPYAFLPGYAEHVESLGNQHYYFAVMDNCRAMPLVIRKGRFLNSGQVQSFPINLVSSVKLSVEEEMHFVDLLLVKLKKEKLCDQLIQPPVTALFQAPPRNTINCSFGTYQLRLEDFSSAETIFQTFHPKHKNVIRNAMNKGVEIKSGEQYLPVFCELYRKTMERSGFGADDENFFKSLYLKLGEHAIRCSVSYHNNIPQGASLILYTQYGGYYVYGASGDKVEITGANNLLQWNTIQYLFEKKVRLYDFVGARLSDVSGTKLDGIQKFKARFGSELKKGFLWKKDIDPVKTGMIRFYKAFNKLRRRSQKPDIIDQEIVKAKIKK